MKYLEVIFLNTRSRHEQKNIINIRQNEEHSIRMLAAQREIYEEVKKYEKILVVFSVMLPIMCSILNIFIKNSEPLETTTYIISLVSLFIGLLFRKCINNEKATAANIQLLFDMYVYQLQWDSNLFGKKRNLDDVIAEKSSKHLMNKDRKNKLTDWYRPEVYKYDYLNSIAFCQKENLAWDGRLRKRYKKCSIILILSISVIILGSGILGNDSLQRILFKLFFIAPLLYWLCDTIKNLNDDIDRLMDVKNKLDEELKIRRLQVIQKEITEHRKHCRSIPKWFYDRFRDKDEMIQKMVDSINP